MDFEILFWLAIFLVPLLRRVFRGRKNKPNAPPSQIPQPQRQVERVERPNETPFADALRQIQEALAEAQQPMQTQPPERVEAPRTITPAAPKPVPSSSQQRDSFGKKRHFFDDEFEAAAPGSSPGADEHYHEPLSDDDDVMEVKVKHRKELSEWQRAVTNLELLGSPRSRKPWRGRAR